MEKTNKILIALFVFLSAAIILLLYVKNNPRSRMAKLLGVALRVPSVAGATGSGGASASIAPTAATGTAKTVVANDDKGSGFPLQLGSTGKAVKMLQAALGIDIDGIWGNKTEKAVVARTGGNTVTADQFSDDCTNVSDSDVSNIFPLVMGSQNIYVKDVQILTGCTIDGSYGVETEAAVKSATGNYTVEFTDYVQLVGNVLGVAVYETTTNSNLSW